MSSSGGLSIDREAAGLRCWNEWFVKTVRCKGIGMDIHLPPMVAGVLWCYHLGGF
jgi:hypothetical protein